MISEPETTPQRSRLLERLNEAWTLRSHDRSRCRELSRALLEEARNHGNLLATGYASRNLGFCAFMDGDHEGALQLLIEGQRIAQGHHDRVLERDCVNFTGGVFNSLGDLNAALRQVDLAYQLNLLLEDEAGIVSCLINTGNLHHHLGQHERAIAAQREALERAYVIGDRRREADALANLGVCLLGAQRFEDAIAVLESAWDLCQELSLESLRVNVLLNLGEALGRSGEFERAIAVLEDAHRLTRLSGSREHELFVLLNTGIVRRAQGETALALESFEAGVKGAEDGFKVLEYQFHQQLAEIFKERHQPALALEHFERFHHLERQVRDASAERTARAMSIQQGLERARAEADLHRARSLELSEALSALEQADAEKTLLLGKLQSKSLELQQQVIRDPLTQIFNRRYLEDRLQVEFARAVRQRLPLTVAMLDVDDFKNINDHYSHQIGDAVLKRIAEIVSSNLRPLDLAARYGGEEFALLFIGTSLPEALIACERLRLEVQRFTWQTIHPNLNVTVSIGLSARTDVDGFEKLLGLADAEMYAAKRSGKNCISSHDRAANP